MTALERRRAQSRESSARYLATPRGQELRGWASKRTRDRRAAAQAADDARQKETVT